MRGEERTDEQQREEEPNSPNQQYYFYHTGTFRMPEGTTRCFSKHSCCVNRRVALPQGRRVKRWNGSRCDGHGPKEGCHSGRPLGAGAMVAASREAGPGLSLSSIFRPLPPVLLALVLVNLPGEKKAGSASSGLTRTGRNCSMCNNYILRMGLK